MRERCNFNRPRIVSRRSPIIGSVIPLITAIVLFAQCAPGTGNEVISRCAMALDSFYNRCEVEGVSNDALPTSVAACEKNEDDYEFFLECYDKNSSCDDFESCLDGGDASSDDDDDFTPVGECSTEGVYDAMEFLTECYDFLNGDDEVMDADMACEYSDAATVDCFVDCYDSFDECGGAVDPLFDCIEACM